MPLPAPLRRRQQRSRPLVFLHIGAMKTGTTFLQGLMSANREALLEAGVRFPGRRWADQDRAVRDVMAHSTDPRALARNGGAWEQLCAEMLASTDVSVVSMEFLSFADDEQARRVIDSLADAEVHVVLTVRDAVTALPAQWQTACRNGGRIPYPRMVGAVQHVLTGTEARLPAGPRVFERTQGIPRMLDVWVPLVGADRLHVITVPARGSDPMLLWKRFAKVIGVRPSVCTAQVTDSNRSLGYASSELLRLLNVALGQVPAYDYDRLVKSVLARQVLSTRAGVETRVPTNRRAWRLASAWNAQMRRSIEQHGVRVVGSLRHELPDEPPGEELPGKLVPPAPEELLAAARTAYDGLGRFLDDLAVDLDRPVLTRDADPAWSAQADPVAAAVDDLATLVRWGLDLRRLERGEETELDAADDFDAYGALDETDEPDQAD